MNQTNPSKYYSTIQEYRIAEALGWDLVVASGSRQFHPGDIIGPEWLCECKTHMKQNASIKFLWSVWKKICDEADSKFRYPVLCVDDGSQQLDHTWCLVRDINMPKDPYIYSDSHIVYEYPYAIRENISFSHTKIIEYVRKHFVYDLYYFKASWNNHSVCIVPFTLFSDLFGENR